MRKALAANAFSFLIVALIILGGVIAWGQKQFDGAGPLTEPTVFEVERNASLDGVADRLVEEGIVGSLTIFRIGARYSGLGTTLKFGEYDIPAGASMREVLNILSSGRSIQYRVTIPEGLTSYEIVELLNQDETLTGEIEDLPPEGTLAPDTYLFSRGDTRQGILDRMKQAQSDILAEAWAGRSGDLPVSNPAELLILASIVEKETGVADERGLVASVFVNRLERNMRLQTDPTVIYGITLGREKLGRGLRQSELRADTPYNTYVISGLPPTPIANPGRESLFAAANPEQSDFLYFVANGTGGHVFAETLAEHNRNVQAWRAIESQQN